MCDRHVTTWCVWGWAGLGGEEEGRGVRGKESDAAAVYDGMEGLSSKAAKLRFGRDLRLLEVCLPCCGPPAPAMELGNVGLSSSNQVTKP